jgi:hypothetical protein
MTFVDAITITVSGAQGVPGADSTVPGPQGERGPQGPSSNPTWLANGDNDAGSFYPETGSAINTTTQFYINDTAKDGGTGWNSYFLQRIGSAPWVLNLADSSGRVSTFSVESITDNGGGYVQLNVTFRNGHTGDWSGVYQLSIASIYGQSAPYNVGNISGNYSPDVVNGYYQYCYGDAGDLTIFAPVRNENPYTPAIGEKLVFEIRYTNGPYLLNFDSSVKMTDAMRTALPVTLEALKAYKIEIEAIGGVWWVNPIKGPAPEIVD